MKHGSPIMKHILRSRVLHGAALTLTAVAMLLATTTATADCGNARGAKSMVFPQMPFLAQHNSGSSNANSLVGFGEDKSSIVGLWHVSYVAHNENFSFESLKTWHSDGTEWENSNGSPTQGNLCIGVWEKTKDGIIHLYHVGWSFDANGNLNGTVVITESNVVARDGKTYQGTFDNKLYDLDGNLVDDAIGTQTATRITPN